LPDIIAHVALMTLGAESEGAEELCRTLIRHGVVVSLGHTAPSYQQYTSLRQAGVTMVTHLYNGMSGLHHRQPGLAAWALTDDAVFCSLITDGVHVDPTMIRLAFRSQPNHVVLVTDRVAHLSQRHQDRLQVIDGAVRLSNGTLAGSLLTMSQALRVCVEAAGISITEALTAATTHPAQVLGLTSQGQIAVGASANLMALDDQYNVQAVWLEGERVR
jgi:N-acetylglucosamine-6-phosphate deacetylase